MVTFKDFSNKEKVAFLSDVMQFYLLQCKQKPWIGLCACVDYVAQERGILIDSAVEFMGEDIWNPTFAGAPNKCMYLHWWPTEECLPRLMFLTRLIHIYSI